MRSHITRIALAATLGTALIGATPALALHGQTRLALAAGHESIWPTANHARAKLDHNYDRWLIPKLADPDSCCVRPTGTFHCKNMRWSNGI
jgi:hypothetical protein